ncbi:IclR family transcriptional regulator [Pararhodobacter oceanensis]|uniref:IclR family transcriptional regulator n=1 Tax=Pararhodobacter oceanensis TaxID=2172121 RepID=UPI003A94010D
MSESNPLPLPTPGTQVIDRTVLLLRLLATFRSKGARLTDLASEADLPPSTAHRILKRLAQHRLVSQDDSGQCYSLGSLAYELGLGHGGEADTVQRHRPLIERVVRETGATGFLLMRSGFDSLCIDRLEPETPREMSAMTIGDRLPLGVGVGGMVLLAELPAEEAARVISGNRSVYQRFARTAGQRLHEDLARAVAEGHVVRRSPVTPGIVGFGLPLRIGRAPADLALSGALMASEFPLAERRKILAGVQAMIAEHLAGHLAAGRA